MSLSDKTKKSGDGMDIQQKTETEDDFCKIDSIGPATERTLKENGIVTFCDIAELRPMELNARYDIVLATATKIITGAVNLITEECPQCSASNEGNFSASWSVVLQEIDQSSELVCESCGWDGKVEEIR